MDKLIDIMAADMGICPYSNEPIDSFEFRVIYSALGLWCLKSATSEKNSEMGISKNSQSILIHELVEKYMELYPSIRYLVSPPRNNIDIAVFIRTVYEQTGYLITLDNNHNVLNQSGETIHLSDAMHLYLGLPDERYTINGLGIHLNQGKKEIALNDFLIRDQLTPEEYLKVKFDECDFDYLDIDPEELEFFNPYYYGKTSSLWHRQMKTTRTMARKGLNGPYYRVIRREDGSYLFAEENNLDSSDSLTGGEFRRIYVALKKYYENPMQLLICPIDGKYTHIRILGKLPNREYYYLLMISWPKNGFTDRNNFIIRNELVTQATEVLSMIGFTARNGEFYG